MNNIENWHQAMHNSESNAGRKNDLLYFPYNKNNSNKEDEIK